jgi:hypothetical protein
MNKHWETEVAFVQGKFTLLKLGHIKQVIDQVGQHFGAEEAVV